MICRICQAPVLPEHAPVPVYDQMQDEEPSGWIHGSFDCMDQERCGSCVLPANHPVGECYRPPVVV